MHRKLYTLYFPAALLIYLTIHYYSWTYTGQRRPRQHRENIHDKVNNKQEVRNMISNSDNGDKNLAQKMDFENDEKSQKSDGAKADQSIQTRLDPKRELSGKKASNKTEEVHIVANETTLLCEGKPVVHSGNLSKRYPKALIIGVKRTGLVPLKAFIRMNPYICMPKKEVHFFDTKMYKSWTYYKTLMPECYSDQFTMDKIPRCFTQSKAPQRVKKFDPNMKLVVLLRDPTTRLVSDFVRQEEEMETLEEETFKQAFFDRNGSVRGTRSMVETGVYVNYIPQWLKLFPASQLLFLDGEELATSPWSTVAKLESFLGLLHCVPRQDFSKNEESGFFCALRSGKKKCPFTNQVREYPRIHPNLTQKIRAFYKPHNEKLYELLKLDFIKGWY